jgi:hypothetical protein
MKIAILYSSMPGTTVDFADSNTELTILMFSIFWMVSKNVLRFELMVTYACAYSPIQPKTEICHIDHDYLSEISWW